MVIGKKFVKLARIRDGKMKISGRYTLCERNGLALFGKAVVQPLKPL